MTKMQTTEWEMVRARMCAKLTSWEQAQLQTGAVQRSLNESDWDHQICANNHANDRNALLLHAFEPNMIVRHVRYGYVGKIDSLDEQQCVVSVIWMPHARNVVGPDTECQDLVPIHSPLDVFDQMVDCIETAPDVSSAGSQYASCSDSEM